MQSNENNFIYTFHKNSFCAFQVISKGLIKASNVRYVEKCYILISTKKKKKKVEGMGKECNIYA